TETSTEDYAWGKSMEISRYLNLTFEHAADHIYTITRVQDGCGNTVVYPLPRPELERKFSVHPTPSVNFATDTCDVNYPVKLLRDRPPARLPIHFHDSKGPFEVGLKFRPYPGAAEEQSLRLTAKTPEISYNATRAGFYELTSIKDSWCEGI